MITEEDGKSLHNELDVVECLQFDRGWLTQPLQDDATQPSCGSAGVARIN